MNTSVLNPGQAASPVTGKSIRNISSGINPYAGPWTKSQVIHLLKRTMFGASKTDIDYFLGRSVTQAIDELINPAAPMPSPPVNEYNGTTPDPVIPLGQTWVNNQTADGTINSVRRASFKKWWMGVMMNQDRSVREKLTLFWANHWGTETRDIGNAQYVYKHHDTIRTMCLGNFKTMVKAITVDPGMLVYLNGYLNTAAAPDENYGRELQELFTIGKDPLTNLAPYAETDVKAAAKVLTGWRINFNTVASYFDSTKHDTTNKQFSSFYGNSVINGRTGAAGALETDDLINLLFSKDETAKYLVRKLYRWFVYYAIDASTEQNVIVPLANILKQNNFEIRPVLRALLLSEHFFDSLNRGCYIKSPCDHIVGALREFNVQFPPASDFYSNYGHWNFLRNYAANMTQDLGDPPNVSGWPSFYQEPQFHEIWINSDTLPKRNQFTDTMIVNGNGFNSTRIKIDPVAYAATLPNPGDPNVLVTDSIQYLLGVDLSAASKAQIKTDFLLSGQTSDYYWTNAWNAYVASPTQANYNIVFTRLRDMYKYLMNLAEYQLC
jgi:uncharacterized protein (DUF1800 family)